MSQSWKKIIRHCMQECINVSVGKFYNKNEEPWNKKASAEFQQKSLLNHTFLKYQSCLSYLFYMNILFITMIAFLFCRKFR